jgi:hypothetical protein
MSQHHLRKEKVCLNCGATVQDKYCSHCGQLNAEPKESIGHLIGHFFADVTHYDSQFITTLRDLVFKPGFLTREYVAGKRASYLNPIRMYIFISAVFFLVSFSQKQEGNNSGGAIKPQSGVNLFRQHLADSLRATEKPEGRLSGKDSIRNGLYSSLAARLDTVSAVKNAADGSSVTANINNHGVVTLILTENKNKSVEQYEKEQKAEPAKKRDNATESYMVKKVIKKILKDGSNGSVTITQNLEHDIPKLMFILLPLFALFIRLFYSRKKYFYSQHLIFSLHFHSFLFIILMLSGLLSNFLPLDKMWQGVIIVTLLVVFIYLAAALHNAYRQPVWLSVIKAFGISVFYCTSIIIGVLVIFASIFVFA